MDQYFLSSPIFRSRMFSNPMWPCSWNFGFYMDAVIFLRGKRAEKHGARWYDDRSTKLGTAMIWHGQKQVAGFICLTLTWIYVSFKQPTVSYLEVVSKFKNTWTTWFHWWCSSQQNLGKGQIHVAKRIALVIIICDNLQKHGIVDANVLISIIFKPVGATFRPQPHRKKDQPFNGSVSCGNLLAPKTNSSQQNPPKKAPTHKWNLRSHDAFRKPIYLLLKGFIS